MKRALLQLLALLLLDAAPVPLISGAVRDQFGTAIGQASVVAGTARTTTQSDGTFVLQSSAQTVHIECRFCRPSDVAVAADGTVAAIVTRYSALTSLDPSAQDVAALPYAHAESLAALRPYAVLLTSSRVLPGPQVALYGSLPGRYGLLIDNGVPSYDSAAGFSPFRTIPGFDVTRLNVRDIQDAPRYGDLAGNGTFYIGIEDRAAALAYSGSQRAVRVSSQSQSGFATAALFADGDQHTMRLDAGTQKHTARYDLGANAFIASNTSVSAPAFNLNSSISAAHALLRIAGPMHPYVDVAMDRAAYANTPSPFGQWSDILIQGGVQTGGAVSVFADAATRFSTQTYTYGRITVNHDVGAASEEHIDAGVTGDSQGVQWQAMLAAVDVNDSIHESSRAVFQHALALTPSFDARVELAPHWTLETTALGVVHVPSLIEREFAAGAGQTALPRLGEERASLEYSDLRRFSFDVSAVHQFGSVPSQSLTSLGAYAAWQIAPSVSLRAWGLHLDDPYYATPASAWLAYRAPSGVTADVIWRRDLLDLKGRTHLDASLALPLNADVKFFAGSEERTGVRYTSFGVRVFAP